MIQEFVSQGLGLLFWNSITFLTVLLILAKFAWKPIMGSIKERENSISDALNAADKAKADIANLQAENEKMLESARLEREKIVREAQAVANNIVAEAKEKATLESNRLIESAKSIINNEKHAAILEVKNHAAVLSVEIAEMLVRRSLNNDGSQTQLVQEYIKEAKMN